VGPEHCILIYTRGRTVSTWYFDNRIAGGVKKWQTPKTATSTKNANDDIVAESMLDIDAEYEALCASNVAVTV
jgi:hypothetical protein